MKKNIVIFLKIAIIMTIGLLIFQIVKNSDFSLASTSSLTGLTRSEFVSAINSNPSLILNGNSSSLVGTKVYCGAGTAEDPDDYLAYKNAACFAHYKSDIDKSTYEVVQAISWIYNSSSESYYAENTWSDGSETKDLELGTTSSSSLTNYLIKLAGSIVYQINVGQSSSDYSTAKTTIGAYFYQCIKNGLSTTSSLSSASWSSSASGKSATYASSYLSEVQNYRKVTCSYEDTVGKKSGDDIIIGPITLDFSGSISSISVGSYSGTVYWATSEESEDWTSTTTGIESGTEIYIKLDTNSLTATETYDITFVQDTGLYNAELIIIASTTNGAQQFGVFEASSEPYTTTTTASIPAYYPINIEIDKTDVESGESIEGIGFLIYDETVGEYIDANGEYQTSSENAIVYTDENGQISITDILVIYGEHIITVTEVDSQNEYYITVDTITETQTISEEGTLTYTPTNEPIKLILSKIDSVTGEAIQGVGFKLQFENGSWVSGNGSGQVSYVETVDEAEEYITDETGTITITGLKKGTYTIYETSFDSTDAIGYYLEDQEGYDSENGWVLFGEVELNTDGTTEYSIELENDKSGNLFIYKYDNYTGDLLSDVYFKLYFVDEGTWVSGEADQNKVYVETAEEATAYGTVDGIASIYYLRLGTYYVYEVSNENEGYYLEDQTEENGLEGYEYDEETEMVFIAEVEITVNTTLEMSEFSTDEDDDTSETEEETSEDDEDTSEEETSEAEEETSEDEEEDSTEEETSEEDDEETSEEGGTETTDAALNVRRLQISGYVWVDDVDKADTYNNLYDDGESLVNGVTVNLYNKNGELAATTTTGSDETYGDGYYFFGYECYEESYEGVKVTTGSIQNFYIEFDYNDGYYTADAETVLLQSGEDEEGNIYTPYIPVAFNSETASAIVDNGSRALMVEVAYEDIDLSGIATTYTGEDDEETYGLSGNLFSLYNSDENVLEYINLGILQIYDPSYQIKENLYYVKIVVNDYEYMYEYGVDWDIVGSDDEVTVPTVSFQDSEDITLYTRYIYPSDIAQAILTNGDSLQVYVVYGITIQNDTTYSVENRYMEEKLCITSLVNTFDTDRYELDTSSNTGDGEAMNDIEEAVNDYFGNWSSAESGDEATYEGDLDELESLETQTVYIQFQVTLDAISEILENPGEGIYEEFPTTATAQAYHIYNRYDWDWTLDGVASYAISDTMYEIYYAETGSTGSIVDLLEHKTPSKTKSSSAPYLVFQLPDDDTTTEDPPGDTDEEEDNADNEYLNREISGVIFEDEDASGSDDDEALGDGQWNANEDEDENVVGNVTVELLDSNEKTAFQYAVWDEDEEKYYLYDGENYYEYNESSGEYVKITDENFEIEGTYISTTSSSDGTYTLSGMVPDVYTLKFTYYDEYNSELQTIIYSSDGSEIDTLSINDYKSTIVTSEAARESLGYDTDSSTSYGDEWYKYLEDDNYSVAVDNLEQREDYNEGLTNIYVDSDGDGELDSIETHSYETDENGDIILDADGNYEEITQMEANTGEFAITVENTLDDDHLGYTTKYYEDSDGNTTTTEPEDLTGYTVYTDSFFAYEFTGFNFGIITQPVQSLDIEKLITNVNLTNTPTTLVDGNPETDDLDGVTDLDGSTNGGSTYTRVELDEDAMYGTVLTLTYEITITNTSQINYYETKDAYYGWYYMFGEKDLPGDDSDGTEDYSEIVYISVDSLYDYLESYLELGDAVYEYVYKNTTSGDFEESQVITLTTDKVDEVDTITTYESDRQGEIDVVTYNIKELEPIARTDETEETGIDVKDVVTLSATKTLSESEEDMAYSNIAEIITASNTDASGTKTTGSIKLVKTPELPEPSEAYISITPPTGSDQVSVLVYIIAGIGLLAILSVGIVIIKKKVL